MSNTKLSFIKHGFFTNSAMEDTSFSFKGDDFDELQVEFSTLYHLFQSNKDQWAQNIEVVLYMNYLCDLMISYYQYDYVNAELQKLKKQRQEIDDFIQQKFVTEEHESINRFPVFLLSRLEANFKEYQASLASVSRLRDNIGSVNTIRSQFGYSRALAVQILLALQNSAIADLVQEINKFFGHHYSFKQSLKLLNQSRYPLALLQVALASFRFFTNLGLIIKHVTHAAATDELSAKRVFKHELEKRIFTMVDDLVWSTVALLTTLRKFTGIPVSAINPIFVAFLAFDAAWIAAQWYYESQKHAQRLQGLILQKAGATELEQVLIQRQIDVLNDEWEAQTAYFIINVLGALILAGSFAVTMICGGQFVLLGLALISMVGNALYNTSDDFKIYQKARIAIKRELANGELQNDDQHQELLKILEAECSEKHNQFWQSLAFNVGGMAFIIAAAVACWPVALGLTILYMGYQLYSSYQKQLDTNTSQEKSHDIYRFFSAGVKDPVALPAASDLMADLELLPSMG